MPFLTEKHGLPNGTRIEGSRSKEYTLAETIEWCRAVGKAVKRPQGQRGRIIGVSNYKGGVTKTFTAVSLAQALSLHGARVLLCDTDPQGSATQLCGISPERDVQFEDTIMPYIDGTEPDLRYALRQTYWDNLDVLPASSSLLGAEFSLPAKAMEKKGYRFWEVLRHGLEPLLDEYDVVIIDTAPSLSHLTVNALVAADALLMPCPPDALDFASSVQFWEVFTELASKLPGAQEKAYDFVSILYTKVKSNDVSSLVKSWMKQAYGALMNGVEIPESEAARLASAQLKTIYDIPKPDGSAQAYKRYKEPMDRLADFVIEQLNLAWS
jgi:chromosome partitioning protein